MSKLEKPSEKPSEKIPGKVEVGANSAQAMNNALMANLRSSIGDMVFQVIQLQVEVAALKQKIADLMKENAELSELSKKTESSKKVE